MPLNFDVSPFQPTTRSQWLELCREVYSQFRTLIEHGVVTNFRLHWVRIVPDHHRDAESQRTRRIFHQRWHHSVDGRGVGKGVPAGVVLTCRDRDGDWYAGASFCDQRDRHRWTREEAIYRALKRLRRLDHAVDFYKPIEEIAWLKHFPPSCRHTVKVDMLYLQQKYHRHGEPLSPAADTAIADD